MSEIKGIVNLIKPPGISSFYAVKLLSRLLSGCKAGHTGTLDPLATGLLSICLGRATKIIPFLPEGKKTYIAELKLGVKTDTLDAEGKMIEQNDRWKKLNEEKIKKNINSFIGQQEQIPPMFSAVHHKGQRLYDLARKGETVDRKPREIEIFDIDILRISLPIIQMKIVCSRGTYIRSLARDIGEKLGTHALLSFLVRTASGPFKLEDSYSFNEIEQQVIENKFDFCKSPDYPFDYPKLKVTLEAEKKAVNGASLLKKDFAAISEKIDLGDKVLVYTPDNNFVSISKIKLDDDKQWICKPLRVFIDP